MPALKAIAINASLKPEGESSTDLMIEQIGKALGKHGVTISETIRLAAHDIKSGVTSDMGDGDAWPAIRTKILAADILVFGGPVWMGQPSSVAKRVCERMDAFLGETDEEGRMPSYNKIVVFAIVGNEDGAHHVTAELAQSLNDTGWTIPPVSACYWVGRAMEGIDFKDLDTIPDKVTQTAGMVADNAFHLAGLLKKHPLPGHE